MIHTVRTIMNAISTWFTLEKLEIHTTVESDVAERFTLTGPALIEQIARCIELGQPVLLEGPRGCGKSYCIRAGFKEAARRGFLPDKAIVTVQGNRETARDYLMEDDIAFKLVPKRRNAGKSMDNQEEGPDIDETAMEVWPMRRDAPLFRFAVRCDTDGSPIQDAESELVLCEINGKPCERFVLFLDEINRFSDGVLDSMLSLLEERTAFLNGEEYKLPVTVCMTMNPPGYDSSARKLSPPLAARIGRSYRLSTPDIDTMCDVIVEERLRKLRIDREVHGRKSLNEVGDGRHSPATEAMIGLRMPDSLILRKAALVTLCLWGDVRRFETLDQDSPSKSASGFEYLTEGSRQQLREVMRIDPEVAEAMSRVSELCHYGPDGRAIADWTVSAVAKAIEDAASHKAATASVGRKHYEHTAVRTLAHKMYDAFSSANRPDLTREKEDAVELVATRILNRSIFDPLVARKVDDPQELWDAVGQLLFESTPPTRGNNPPGPHPVAFVRRAFIFSRVTDDKALMMWKDILAGVKPIQHAVFGVNTNLIQRHADTSAPGGKRSDQYGFCASDHDALVRALAKLVNAASFVGHARLLIEIASKNPDHVTKLAESLTITGPDDRPEYRLSRVGLLCLDDDINDACRAMARIITEASAEFLGPFEAYLDEVVRVLRDSRKGSDIDSFEVPEPTRRLRVLAKLVDRRLGPVARPLREQVLDRTVVRLMGSDAFLNFFKSGEPLEGIDPVREPDRIVDIASALDEAFLSPDLFIFSPGERGGSLPSTVGSVGLSQHLDDLLKVSLANKHAVRALVSAASSALRRSGERGSYARADRFQRAYDRWESLLKV